MHPYLVNLFSHFMQSYGFGEIEDIFYDIDSARDTRTRPNPVNVAKLIEIT